MIQLWMNDFQGSQWKGRAELWLDPEGNQVAIEAKENNGYTQKGSAKTDC